MPFDAYDPDLGPGRQGAVVKGDQVQHLQGAPVEVAGDEVLLHRVPVGAVVGAVNRRTADRGEQPGGAAAGTVGVVEKRQIRRVPVAVDGLIGGRVVDQQADEKAAMF